MRVAEDVREKDQAIKLGRLVKEIITDIMGFRDVNVYVDTLEPYPYIILEIDYRKLSEEERSFFFSFEYKFNKILSTLMGSEAPYVEFLITPDFSKGQHHVKIDG